MVSTIWVLTGNAAVPRLRLGQLFRGFRMRCGGGEARGEIRKFPQIAQPTAKSGSQAVGGGGAAQLGGSWPVGTGTQALGSWARGRDKAGPTLSSLFSLAYGLLWNLVS